MVGVVCYGGCISYWGSPECSFLLPIYFSFFAIVVDTEGECDLYKDLIRGNLWY